jgi:CoA-transferase family III
MSLPGPDHEMTGVEALWRAAMGPERATLDTLEVVSPGRWLGGPLAVDELALGSAAVALLSAAELAAARTGRRPAVSLSAEHVALSFRSERHLLVGGTSSGSPFAPLSRMLRCADGRWARTHGNYPHHAAALAGALGFDLTGEDARDVTALEVAAATSDAVALEEAVIAAGGCAAALRSRGAWAEHPAGRSVASQPLIAWDHDLGLRPRRALPSCASSARPCDGIRVLDLTRVIAGPVAGRTLAALGAEVLRVDPPALPELRLQHLDTGPGKRSAIVDLADADRREALLAAADVVLIGYRPGALDRFGLGSEQLARRHPQLVQVRLSAWGAAGPWARRRGFDSLVQVATGIAAACADADGAPGVLPAQALDHATGHLAAAAALRGLLRRATGEPIAPARLSLARTAQTLLDLPRPARSTAPETELADARSHRVAFGEIELIGPPGALDGEPLRWDHGPRPLGGDDATWA